MTIAAIVALLTTLLGAFLAGRRSGSAAVVNDNHEELNKAFLDSVNARIQQAKEKANDISKNPGADLVDELNSDTGKGPTKP